MVGRPSPYESLSNQKINTLITSKIPWIAPNIPHSSPLKLSTCNFQLSQLFLNSSIKDSQNSPHSTDLSCSLDFSNIRDRNGDGNGDGNKVWDLDRNGSGDGIGDLDRNGDMDEI